MITVLAAGSPRGWSNRGPSRAAMSGRAPGSAICPELNIATGSKSLTPPSIDLASCRRKPGSDRPSPGDPGEVRANAWFKLVEIPLAHDIPILQEHVASAAEV